MPEAFADGTLIERLGHCQRWQIQRHRFRFPDRDAEILQKMLDEEPGLEIPLEDARPEVVDAPGAGSATATAGASPSLSTTSSTKPACGAVPSTTAAEPSSVTTAPIAKPMPLRDR